MACSSEVIGPDSLASVDIVPVIAASTSAGTQAVRPYTAPLTPMTASSEMYMRRRPSTSPHLPTAKVISAMPPSIAVNSAPTPAAENPSAARADPRMTAPKPYANARTVCTAMTMRAVTRQRRRRR